MDKVFKTYRATVKEVNADEGIIDMFIPISSGQVDRDGEVIEPAAFKKTIPKFMKHPVLVASHDYKDLTNQIGEWTNLKVEGDGVSGKPKYYVNAGNDQADWAFYLASKGVAAFSVGFIPKTWEDGKDEKSPRRTYKDVELLEISQVIIPSNREAVQSMRSKSVDPVITELCDEIVNADILDLTTKPEETQNYYRVPIPSEEGKHADHKIRTIDISKDKGIKALYCVDDKKNITYLFDKEKWESMEAARAWMMEHMGKDADEIMQKHTISQQEILDEIDYLSSLVKEVGLNKDALESLTDILEDESDKSLIKVIEMEAKAGMSQMKKMAEMMGKCEEMCGKCKEICEGMMDDMEDYEDMDEDKSVHLKAGAVLNKKNKANLNQIKGLAQEVLDSAGSAEHEEEEKRVPSSDMLVKQIDINDILSEIQSTKL